jgi:hypothetical protein
MKKNEYFSPSIELIDGSTESDILASSLKGTNIEDLDVKDNAPADMEGRSRSLWSDADGDDDF